MAGSERPHIDVPDPARSESDPAGGRPSDPNPASGRPSERGEKSERIQARGALPEHHTGPGLVDLQLNGYAGYDFNGDPSSITSAVLRDVRDRLYRRGVVAALPTFITDDAARMVERAAAYARALNEELELEATFPGLQIEGPFLSPEDGPRGAHPLTWCRTPRDLPDLYDRLREASGDRISILTLAPELPGALELIERASGAGTTVALGHTAASRTCLLEAVDAGARMSTHLGNGSHEQLPRLDNYVQAQLAEDRLFSSFIADGHHIPFYTLKNFLRAKSSERSILVTDAVAAADAEPGEYLLAGEHIVATDDGLVRKPGESNLAGSALTLDRAVVNVARHCAVPFEEAWAMASVRPAVLIGLPAPDLLAVHIRETGFRTDTG